MSDLLKVEHLTKYYTAKSTVAALCDVNLTIPRGRIIGLLGPNGSGKTTLIKIVNGLLQPSSGSVLINGKKPGPESKAVVSYLPDRPCLPEGKTIKDIVDFYRDFYDDFEPERAYDMLAMLKINPEAQIRVLSKGTKEKAMLIMVMSRRAQLYILDEPIAGVDPAARDYIISTIINNYSEDASVIISTHLISDVEPVLDDAIFIKNGRIEMESSVEELREKEGKSLDAYFREVFACL